MRLKHLKPKSQTLPGKFALKDIKLPWEGGLESGFLESDWVMYLLPNTKLAKSYIDASDFQVGVSTDIVDFGC